MPRLPLTLRGLLILLCASPMACAHRPQLPIEQATLGAGATAAPAAYAIEPGDLIAVKFYRNPELNEEVTVRPDGMISLQLIGDVQAAGRTPDQLNHTIEQRYTGELASPKATVIVRKIRRRAVYVGGEVGKPGVVPLVPGLSLFQAIQQAGGLLKTADRGRVVLIRRGVDGRATGSIVDTRVIADGERPDTDVPLLAYDTVVVPTSTVADINLFVEQYIRNNLPIQPGFAFVP